MKKRVYHDYVKGSMGDCDYCIGGHYIILKKDGNDMRVKCDKCGRERNISYAD